MVYFCLILYITIVQSFKLQTLNFNENSFKKSYLNLDDLSSQQKGKELNNIPEKELGNKIENKLINNNMKPESLKENPKSKFHCVNVKCCAALSEGSGDVLISGILIKPTLYSVLIKKCLKKVAFKPVFAPIP